MRWLAVLFAVAACGGPSRPPEVVDVKQPAPQSTPTTPSTSSSAKQPPSEVINISEEAAVSKVRCDQGDYNECAKLGWAFYTGKGAPRDLKRAYLLFSDACNHGVEKGCVPLGYMYQIGQVVSRDLEKAISIFQPLCEHGSALVCIGLGELYEKEKSDLATALVWFHRACTYGEPSGCDAEQRLAGKKARP